MSAAMNELKEELKAEYAALRSTSMTVGERYTNEGQAKLDREVYVLGVLAAIEGIPAYEYATKFEKGLV
ncbi:MAG TPA: hypothetical protein VFM18_17960 [Methanosarcina sp.]|nr:hypothetical protein [Methanosarcina sp.]